MGSRDRPQGLPADLIVTIVPTPSSSAEHARHALADRLREIRLDAGFDTARAFSEEAGWHEAKTSRIEHAQKQPSEDDLRAWCHACDAENLLPQLIAELRQVDSMWLDWRRTERHGLLKINKDVRTLYEETRVFRFYSSVMIPGPVQTAEYVRALLNGIRPRRRIVIDDVEAAVAERMARQHIVYEGDHRFCIVLEEAALRLRIGGPRVLAGQLRHLLAIQNLPSMTLGIIPATVDRSEQWPTEMFFLFDDAQVNVELISGFLTITQPDEVALYAQDFARLVKSAVVGAGARGLIEQVLAELEA
jgi:hypothetical protein